MHRYEVMVILDPSLDDRTVKSSIEKFLEVVTKDGGKVENLAVWGRRHLSYPIQKHGEAIYVVINLECKSESVLELDRQLRLNEAVLRTKVLRAEEAVFEISQSDASPRASESRPARSAAKPATGAASGSTKVADTKAAPKTATKTPAKAAAKPAEKSAAKPKSAKEA